MHSVDTFAEHLAGGTTGTTASIKACCFRYDGRTPIAEAEAMQRRKMQEVDAKGMAANSDCCGLVRSADSYTPADAVVRF